MLIKENRHGGNNMNVSNLTLDEQFSNTVPLSLPQGVTVDVSQIIGIVPISKGGTGANNAASAASNLNVLQLSGSGLDFKAKSYNQRLLIGVNDENYVVESILWNKGSCAFNKIHRGSVMRYEAGVWQCDDPYNNYAFNYDNYCTYNARCNNVALGYRAFLTINQTDYPLYGNHSIGKGTGAYTAGTTGLLNNLYYCQYS